MPPAITADSAEYEVAALGQVFTPPAIVDCMLTLVRNRAQ